MKTLFITGGAGFIARHFIARFASDYQCIGYDLKAPDFEGYSAFFTGDIRDAATLQAAIQSSSIDAIVHLAAAHADAGISKETYESVNIKGMENLLVAADAAAINTLLFVSSVAVYGEPKAPADEQTLPAPVNPYGATKLAAEELLRRWVQADDQRIAPILRPTVVFGEYNFANMYRFIRQISRGLYFTIGKGNNIKSIAYVGNVVQAMDWLLHRTNKESSVWNYVDEPQMTVKQLGDATATLLNKPRPISMPYVLLWWIALPFEALHRLSGGRFPISLERLRKLRTPTHFLPTNLQTAGFQPHYTLLDGLKRTVGWYKEEGK